MAWTTPRTWTTGELVTAAFMNAHVRDNLDYLYTVIVTTLGLEGLSDPGADRIVFWDDSEGALKFLTVSTGLAVSGTNLTTYDSEIDHGSLGGLAGDDHTQYLLRQPAADVVINESGGDYNFRIESTGEDNLFYIDAGADVVRIGDMDTNYAQFAADGELTLIGTARVVAELELQAASISAGASGVVLNTDYLPYVGYDFGIGDNMYCQFEVPYNWDSSTNLTVYLYWAINEARTEDNEEVQWAVDWKACPVDESEAIDAPTHTGSIDYGDQLIPETAKYLTKTTAGTIAAASLAAGDLIGLDVNRVALDDGNSPTDEPILYRIEVEYTINKLGEAT